MWIDLFKPVGSHSPTPSVDRVDRVDDMSTQEPIQPLVGAAASTASVAKCVDRVDPGKADLVGTPLLISASSPPDVAPGGHSPHAAMPTASASNESTQSTQSTPGIFCRLLTAAQKNAFLALFELDLDLIEIETRVAGNDTANELRRAINVVWRLLTVEELDFNTAITKATEWVVAQPMHPDELLFADVLTFSRGHDEK